MLSRKLLLISFLLLPALLASCSKDMEVQNRTKAQSRPAVSSPQGTVAARIETHATDSTAPVGRERFEIYCTPCHDSAGLGRGLVVQRGFPPPESFLSSRVVQLSDQNLFDTISDGLGVMPAFKRFITSDDRKAIVAYIRVLQHDRSVK